VSVTLVQQSETVEVKIKILFFLIFSTFIVHTVRQIVLIGIAVLLLQYISLVLLTSVMCVVKLDRIVAFRIFDFVVRVVFHYSIWCLPDSPKPDSPKLGLGVRVGG